jgi:hypothetical protein
VCNIKSFDVLLDGEMTRFHVHFDSPSLLIVRTLIPCISLNIIIMHK